MAEVEARARAAAARRRRSRDHEASANSCCPLCPLRPPATRRTPSLQPPHDAAASQPASGMSARAACHAARPSRGRALRTGQPDARVQMGGRRSQMRTVPSSDELPPRGRDRLSLRCRPPWLLRRGGPEDAVAVDHHAGHRRQWPANRRALARLHVPHLRGRTRSRAAAPERRRGGAAVYPQVHVGAAADQMRLQLHQADEHRVAGEDVQQLPRRGAPHADGRVERATADEASSKSRSRHIRVAEQAAAAVARPHVPHADAAVGAAAHRDLVHDHHAHAVRVLEDMPAFPKPLSKPGTELLPPANADLIPRLRIPDGTVASAGGHDDAVAADVDAAHVLMWPSIVRRQAPVRMSHICAPQAEARQPRAAGSAERRSRRVP